MLEEVLRSGRPARDGKALGTSWYAMNLWKAGLALLPLGSENGDFPASVRFVEGFMLSAALLTLRPTRGGVTRSAGSEAALRTTAILLGSRLEYRDSYVPIELRLDSATEDVSLGAKLTWRS